MHLAASDLALLRAVSFARMMSMWGRLLAAQDVVPRHVRSLGDTPIGTELFLLMQATYNGFQEITGVCLIGARAWTPLPPW
jgi:hypothetical protein